VSIFVDIAIAMDRAIRIKNNINLPDAAREYNNLIRLCNAKIGLIMSFAKEKHILPNDFVWVEYLVGVREPGFVVSDLVHETTRKISGDNVIETFKSIIFIPGEGSGSIEANDKLVYCYSSDNKMSYKYGTMCYLREVKPVSNDPLSHVNFPVLENVFSGLKLIEQEFKSL